MRPGVGSSLSGRQKWLLAAILGIGALLRLTYLLEAAQGSPDFASPRFEAQYHDYWARALLSDDWTPPARITDPEIRSRAYFRPPGYPYFLAAVYGVLGPSYLWPRLVQMALGLGVCLLVFFFTRRAFGNIEGLGATALAGTYWLSLFFEGELMAPALLSFLLLLALNQIARWTEGFTHSRAATAGLLLGLAAVVRPNVLVLPVVSLAWIVWLRHRRRLPIADARLLLPAATFCAALAFAILPVTFRNWAVSGEPVLLTSNGGINLFIGTHPDNDGTTPGVRELGEIAGLSGWDSFDYPKIARAVSQSQGRPMGDAEVSRYFSRRALEPLAEDPGGTLRRTFRKLLLFWGPAEVSNNKVLAAERANSPTLSLGSTFPVLLACGLFGLSRLIRTRSARPLPEAQTAATTLLLGWILAYSASYLPFFVAARFRIALVPWLAILGGVGIGALWRSRKAPRALAMGLLSLGAIWLLVRSPWVPYEDDFALWHYRRGLLYQEQGHLDLALEELQAAHDRDPENPRWLLGLAPLWEAAGQHARAIEAYEKLLDSDPRSLVAHNNLALLYARSNRLSEAILHWQAALDLEPERISLLNNLAIALATGPEEVRDPPRAVELAERASRLTGGGDPRIQSTLEMAQRAAADGEEGGAP